MHSSMNGLNYYFFYSKLQIITISQSKVAETVKSSTFDFGKRCLQRKIKILKVLSLLTNLDNANCLFWQLESTGINSYIFLLFSQPYKKPTNA